MEKRSFLKGLALIIVLTFGALCLFYGSLIPVLNEVYFSASGDGLQSYVNMQYHIRYDDSYLWCRSMNYPYGEHIFYTNCQPLISNTIKLLDELGIDLSGYTTGIVNGLLILSIALASVLLYLIFAELGVGWVTGALAGVGIAFLSPQLDRFGGHLSLAYVCAIPWFIYLLMRFSRNRRWGLSVLISITVLASALTHIYLFAFLMLMLLVYYAGEAITCRKTGTGQYKWLFHLMLQIIVPLLVLWLFTLTDPVTDRPAHPWGFLYYRAYPQSVFLPLAMPYGRFLARIVPTHYIDWEGYAYVGAVASVATLVLLWKFFRNLSGGRMKNLLRVSPDRTMNLLFWASVLALLYSFGIPFIFGLERWVDYTGPLQQLRGIARFSWIYFYVMNIVAFSGLWHNRDKGKKKTLPMLLLILAMAILFVDAYVWVRNRAEGLQNPVAALREPDVFRTGKIRPADYQAIIPLPFFHIGSENIWVTAGCGSETRSLITGEQTGLPSMAVLLSRTSLDQSMNTIGLMLDLSQGAVDRLHLPSDKPLLLVVPSCAGLDRNAKQLIAHAQHLDSTGHCKYYALPARAFTLIYDSIAYEVHKAYQPEKLYPVEEGYCDDSLKRVLFLNVDDMPSGTALAGAGGYSGIGKRDNILFEGSIPGGDTLHTYVASFWMGCIRTDLYPRTVLEFTEHDTNGNVVQQWKEQVFRRIVMIDGDRALVESSFRILHPANTIRISIMNRQLGNKHLPADELLIRNSTVTFYTEVPGGVKMNNRFYPSRTSE